MSVREARPAGRLASRRRRDELVVIPVAPGYSGSVSLGELLGVDVSRSDGDSATATLIVDERHLNAAGTVHGGVIATLVDVAMGAAVFAGSDDDERPVTIEMKVNYLEAGDPGALRAVANVRRRGSRFTVLEAEVLQDDRVIAFATGSFTTISR